MPGLNAWFDRDLVRFGVSMPFADAIGIMMMVVLMGQLAVEFVFCIFQSLRTMNLL